MVTIPMQFSVYIYGVCLSVIWLRGGVVVLGNLKYKNIYIVVAQDANV